MLRKVYLPKQLPKISIFKHILKASETLSYDAKVILWHSCNFSSTNPLQSRILFLLFKERNKCNFCFPSTIFWSCLICLEALLPTSQGEICANLPRFDQHWKYILQRFRKYWWHVLRFEKKIVKEGVWDSHRTEQEDFSLKLWRVKFKASEMLH